MSTRRSLTQEVSVDEQGFDGTEADEREVELRPTVEQQTQAKVDANHPDAREHALTLAAEEKLAARNAEIARTRRRVDSRQDWTREARTRKVARAGSVERRRSFAERAASVDPWAAPDRGDPRAELDQGELATVNEEVARIESAVRESSRRAAISRQLAERVVAGADVADAVVGVLAAERVRPGTVVPIGELEDVARRTVSIQGTVETLWTPASASIQQVGLIADETGRTKFTVWTKSNQSVVEEGETVRFREAALSRYGDRCSVALTGWSRVEFPERNRWWNA